MSDFVVGANEADAHYAGKGVKVDATDTPIFWYRPEGKAKYRVIRADLSVVDMQLKINNKSFQILAFRPC